MIETENLSNRICEEDITSVYNNDHYHKQFLDNNKNNRK